jgi:hypothetical protein
MSGMTLREVYDASRSLEIVEPDGRVLRCNMEIVEQMAAQGMTISQVAAILGIPSGELRTRTEAANQLRIAIEKGKALGVRTISQKLFEQAVSGNTIAGMFYLKAVGGWREADKRPPEDGDGEGGAIKIYLPEKDVDEDKDI